MFIDTPMKECLGNDLEHLLAHGDVTPSCSLGGASAVGVHGSGGAISVGEVVGHLGVEILGRLLLLALAATSSTAALATSVSTSTSGNSLLGGSRLRLVLPGLTVDC